MVDFGIDSVSNIQLILLWCSYTRQLVMLGHVDSSKMCAVCVCPIGKDSIVYLLGVCCLLTVIY